MRSFGRMRRSQGFAPDNRNRDRHGRHRTHRTRLRGHASAGRNVRRSGEVLLRSNESGGYDSPAEIEAVFDISIAEEIIADHPRAVYEVAELFPQLTSGTSAILDYLTQLCLPKQQQTLTDTSAEDQLSDLRDKVHTMVGELHVMYESLRRVAVRHPEIDHEQWQTNTAQSGGR